MRLVVFTSICNFFIKQLIFYFQVAFLKMSVPPQTLSLVCGKIITACKNRMYGCNYIENMDKVKQHEKTCIIYGCPVGKILCDWQGVMHCVEDHCRDDHKFNKQVLPVVKVNEILSLGESILFYPAVIGSERRGYSYFRVCFKFDKIQTTDSSIMYIACQYIGEATLAKKYDCFVDFEERRSKSRGRLQLNCSPFTTEEKAFENSTRILLEHLKGSTLHFRIDYSLTD